MNKYDVFKNVKSKIWNAVEKISKFSSFSLKNGMRRKTDLSDSYDYRQSFSVDADRIIHSLSYARYVDKTQVFSFVVNDHITHRELHVQLVSRIARTVGRILLLNEDLIEAISLGHDIGHSPFGHDGEEYLSELCNEAGIGNFIHSVQSVQFLDRIERKGKGLNLCLQTLDGILCHDGEANDHVLVPNYEKTFQTLENEIEGKKKNSLLKIFPMTLEGCVVRISDVIGYIGRDFEDAIRLNLIKRSDLPKEISSSIGNTNGTIIFNLVTDLICNSIKSEKISFSSEIREVLKFFKKFNFEKIYTNIKIKENHQIIKKLFGILFEICINNLEKNEIKSGIFSNFLDGMSEEYLQSQSNAEIVRDYISGMTDRFFLNQFEDRLRPKIIL